MTDRLRLTPLPVFLSRPSSARYGALAGALAHCAARYAAGSDSLAEARAMLQVILAFITSDPELAAAVLPGPLVKLHNALHDLEQGARPALFFDRPRPLATRPADQARYRARGFLAAALDLLIRFGRMQAKDAAGWLEGECWRAGVRDTGDRRITAQRLARWRNDVTANDAAPASARDTYNEVVARYARVRERFTSLDDAQSSARLIVQNVARLVSP